MKRFLLALTTAACLSLLVAGPASAQYGGGDEPPPSGCPDGTDGPCEPRAPATVSDADVAPGESITVSTPPVFAPGSEVTVNLIHVDRGETPVLSETGTTNAEGAAGSSITIPDVGSGVYFVYVVGLDEDGNRIVAIVPIVIRNATAAASVEGDSTQSQAAPDDATQSGSFETAAAEPVPAAVASVQTDLDADTEAAIVDTVASGNSGLVLADDGTLNVRTPEGATQAAGALASTGNDVSGPVTAGAAMILAGTGFVLLHRRKEARR